MDQLPDPRDSGYTLGHLIHDLTGLAEQREALNRMAADNPLAYSFLQIPQHLTKPDWQVLQGVPGLDRIRALCNRDGDELSLQSVLKIRGRLCDRMSPEGADQMLLAEVAGVFSASQPPTNERFFMELAIAEARKSIQEGGRKVPLYVGAVVVKDGVVLASAHRGEMGPGEHAEYTVLEKKLKDTSVSGATVYTTLEPCTSRGPGKIPCAGRLIERQVKRVVIGVLDPNRDIGGLGQRTLIKAGIDATTLFPIDLVKQLEELNREFTRQFEGTTTSGQRHEVEIGPVYGGIVTVGSVPGPCFHFRIKNGGVRATIKIMIVRITHVQNQDKRLERSWEGHWRGMPGEFDGTLEPLQESDYALLGTSRFPSGNPTLFIWTKDGPVGGVSYDAPLESQGSLRVDVVINGTPTSVNAQPWTQQFSFTMVPAPGSPNLYEVTDQTT
jgi:pyrimidine deaminase RibD-like protein